MTPAARGAYRRYRAPAEDGAALVDPAWSTLLAQLRESASAARDRQRVRFGGVPIADLMGPARDALLAAAAAYTPPGEPPAAGVAAAGPVVVSGHQPELFHPGVWFKNFALDALAKASGGVGVHLLIDSDLCRTTTVRAPTGSVDEPRSEAVAYDARREPVPHEERRLADPAVFEAFAVRAAETVAPFVDEPLAPRCWDAAVAAAGRADRLGEAVSAARHAIERGAGCATLELPFSRVCDTAPFRRFVAELVGRADDFRAAYNASLADYRAAHKLRSAAQPLPDLAAAGGAVETAFWCWRDADTTRRPLLARRLAGRVEVGDGASWFALPADAGDAADRLAELRAAGWKIRSRALATTLFCRWVLADLFLHGIGGAKYDQVTDAFSHRFFGAAPPPHATLTATLRLPIAEGRPPVDDEAALRRELRDLRFHPERFADGGDEHARRFVAEKAAAVATPKTPATAAVRHRRIVAANEALAATLDGRRRRLLDRLASADRRRRAADVLDSREYSFCLFPAGDLPDRLRRLADPAC